MPKHAEIKLRKWEHSRGDNKHLKPLSHQAVHIVAMELFNFPERRENARKSWYFSWKIVCHGVLTVTKGLLRSSHGVPLRSMEFLVAILCAITVLSRCFHGAFTACPQRSQCLRRALRALPLCWRRVEGPVTSQRTLCSLLQTQRTTTAFAQRPLCAPTELLLHCRRPYCAAMVTLRRPLCALLGRLATVFVLSMHKVRALARRSMRSRCFQW